MRLSREVCRRCIERQMKITDEQIEHERDDWERYCLWHEHECLEIAMRTVGAVDINDEVFPMCDCPHPQGGGGVENCPWLVEHVVMQEA
jgi:hypothetical protein